MLASGEKLVKAEPSLVNVNISPRGSSTRVICFVGTKAKEAGVAADALVRELSKALGGSGGGTKDFAQGGGPKADRRLGREGHDDQVRLWNARELGIGLGAIREALAQGME